MADNEASSSTCTDMWKELHELRQKHEAVQLLLDQAVIEEYNRDHLPPNREARKRRVEWQLEEIEAKKAAEAAGKDYDREKMLTTPANVLKKIDDSKKRKRVAPEVFSGFEARTQKQYERLSKQIKPDMNAYEDMKKSMGEDFYPTANTLIQGAHYPAKSSIDRLVQSLDEQAKRREQFHRRRVYDPDAPIDFINERNRKFNTKIERYYGEHTEDIKQNLERGTDV